MKDTPEKGEEKQKAGRACPVSFRPGRDKSYTERCIGIIKRNQALITINAVAILLGILFAISLTILLAVNTHLFGG